MSENVGIPTLYKDIQFRSRLDARWAAFFDLLGWDWAYEPIDLPGWIPDFVLFSLMCQDVFVEVKPISSFKEFEDEKKIVDSIKKTSHSGDQILVLGHRVWEPSTGMLAFGWIGSWVSAGYRPDIGQYGYYMFDVACVTERKGFWGFESQGTGHDHWRPGASGVVLDEFRSLWAKAGNAVQWKPAK